MANTPIPTPILFQTIPPADQQVQIFEVPAGVLLGTLSLRILNQGTTNSFVNWWLTPAGLSSTEDKHKLQSNLELKPGASMTEFGFAVAAGFKVFVQATGNKTSFALNLITHNDIVVD